MNADGEILTSLFANQTSLAIQVTTEKETSYSCALFLPFAEITDAVAYINAFISHDLRKAHFGMIFNVRVCACFCVQKWRLSAPCEGSPTSRRPGANAWTAAM